MKNTRREFMGLAVAAALAKAKVFASDAGTLSFTPDLESFKQYRAPDWFRDAKLGFWACWGPEAVPEMGDWYARQMYIEGHPQYEDHLTRYGHPSKFGYKDIVPLWKGENWEPDRLMRLYKKSGAKYFCAIAQHHDNIDCWNSKFHRWNSVKMGPKRDVIGLWREAARKQGLRFGVTEHLAASWNWYGVTKLCDQKGPMAGVAYDGVNLLTTDTFGAEDEQTIGERTTGPQAAVDYHARRGDFKPGFRIELHIKDLGNVLDTAHNLGVPIPLTGQVMEIMQALKVDGKAKNDHSSIVQFYEKLAKVEVRR
jgi:alpha-L-fucosidase